MPSEEILARANYNPGTGLTPTAIQSSADSSPQTGAFDPEVTHVGVGGYKDFHVDFSLPSTTTFVEFRLDYLDGTGDLFVEWIDWE